MFKPYFKIPDNAPQPLECTVQRKIRFEEVDQLGIVWHGRYPSYFEDGRGALGEKYSISYLDFYGNNIIAPVKTIHIDYHKPLSYPETINIKSMLHWSDSARLNIEYVITDHEGELMTTGYTIQMMLDLNKNLYMVLPPFYQEFCRKWKAGELK